MLKLEELLAVLRMAQVIGPRRFGHFDHEAKASIGPFPRHREDAGGPPSGDHSQKTPSDRLVARYEAFEDPATGETLYRPV